MAAKYNRKLKAIHILLRDNPHLKNNAQSLVDAYEDTLKMEKLENDRRSSRELKEQVNAS